MANIQKPMSVLVIPVMFTGTLYGGVQPSANRTLIKGIVDFWKEDYNTPCLSWCKRVAMEFKNILVPVIGTVADDEAIKLACRLAKRDKGKIWAVYVITVKRTMPLDAEIDYETRKAEEILDHAESIAEEEEYELETDLLQAREAGPTIVEEAVEREVDLILIGIEYKRRFGQFSLGSVVPYVLKNAHCRVILYHQPIG